MKKIYIFLFLIAPLLIYSQDVQFTASSKTHVAVGEQFQVNYTVNAQGNSFKSPDFKGFEVLMGPSQSFSQSTQYINGKREQSIALSFIYVLQATKTGTFTIPPAKINVNGKLYESNSLTINVGGSNSNANNSNSGQKNQGSKQNSSRDLYIVANIDKINPYQGEQVVVTYKLYTRVAISNYGYNKIPSFSGFWSYDLIKDKDKLEQYREVIDGQQYDVAVLRKMALFPQKSGALQIDPLEMECIVQTLVRMQNSFDAFFNDPFSNSPFVTYQETKRKIASNAIVVNVKPLPTNNKPADFNNNVGKFTVSAKVNKDKAKSNEAITLKYTISGKGNFQLIEKPELNLPSDIEVYEPKIIDNINYAGNIVNGSRTYEFLIIPRNGGEFVINPIPFSYFDVTNNQYVTLNTDEIKLTIEKGAENLNNTASNYSVNKQDVKYVNKDIRYIKTKALNIDNSNHIFFGSTLFIILIILPLIILAVFILILRKKIIESSNISLVRNKKASKEATKRLKTAKKYLHQNNKKQFYEEISKALWGYVSDKCNINNAELSKEILFSTLKNKEIDENIIKEYIEIIDKCEFARFAPTVHVDSLENTYNEASAIIEKIDKNLK